MDIELDEVGMIIRFLNEDVANIVNRMIDDENVEMEVIFTEERDGSQLGWLRVKGKNYRCRVVSLPTYSETYAIIDGEIHTKSADLRQAIIVARESDVENGNNAATMEIEMTQSTLPDGLLPPTQSIQHHYTKLASCAPSASDTKSLIADAEWVERTKEEPSFKVSIVPVG